MLHGVVNGQRRHNLQACATNINDSIWNPLQMSSSSAIGSNTTVTYERHFLAQAVVSLAGCRSRDNPFSHVTPAAQIRRAVQAGAGVLFAAHLAARAINVDLHVFLVLRVQVEHGGHQLIAQLLIHRLAEEDDALPVLDTHHSP